MSQTQASAVRSADTVDETASLPPHPVLRSYYESPDDRQAVVNGMFDETAVHYDRVTGLMSFWTGGPYRRFVLKRAGVQEGSRVLDVACGTGQVSAAAKRLVGSSGTVLGVDPSEGMRAVAEARRGIQTVAGTADNLPVEDASFDFVLMGYALRHVADLRTSFEEMRRVLKPGGKVVILEIIAPQKPISRALVKFYLHRIVPPVSMVVTRSRKAKQLMEYYWESIDQCVRPEVILDALGEAGLKDATREGSMRFLSEYVATAP